MIQRRSEDRELNQARSTPDTVDHCAHHYNGIQYCSTETVLLTVLLIQTNIKSQTSTSAGKRVIKVPDTILPLVVKSTLVNDRSSDRIM